MKRKIFKTIIVTLMLMLCPLTVHASIIREIPAEEYAPNLPEHIYGLLVQENCKIYEVTTDDKHVPNGAAGVCSDNIYIKKGYIDHAIYHEIGHFYDYYCIYPSDTKTFNRILESEKDSFLQNMCRNNNYYTNDAQEYFAESFEYYIKDPVKLKMYAPQTYAYIDKKITDPICRRKDITGTAVGEECTVDYSDELPYITDIEFENTDMCAYVHFDGTQLYVKGISHGKMPIKLMGPNNAYVSVRCDVPGKPTKQKKYNEITDVISKVKTKNNTYTNLCIARPYSNEFLLLATSATSTKPDLKITFYDYNKKKVGSCKIKNETQSGDPFGLVYSINPSHLKISQKKFDTIEYYRIEEI